MRHKKGSRQRAVEFVYPTISALINKGMLIDVDHMSTRAFDGALTMAEQNKYAGIMATHVLSFDLHQQPNRGSAIFLHDERGNIEQGRPSSTAGCTSMSEANIQRLVRSLKARAMVLQVPMTDLDTVVDALQR